MRWLQVEFDRKDLIKLRFDGKIDGLTFFSQKVNRETQEKNQK